MSEGQPRLIDTWKKIKEDTLKKIDGICNTNESIKDYQDIVYKTIQGAMYCQEKRIIFACSTLKYVEELRKWLEEEHGLKTNIQKGDVEFSIQRNIVKNDESLLVYWE